MDGRWAGSGRTSAWGDTARVRSGAVQNNLCKAAAMSATSVSRLSVTLMPRSYAMSWSTSSSSSHGDGAILEQEGDRHDPADPLVAVH